MNGLWVTALALLLVPGAAAELRIAEVVGPDKPLVPDLENAAITLTIQLDCQDALPRLSPGANSIRIDLNATAPAGVLVSGSAAVELPVDPAKCLPPVPLETTAEFWVSVTQDLPGLTPVEITFVASLPPYELDEEPPTHEASVQVEAAPFVLLDAQTMESLVLMEGDAATITMQLINRGNTPLEVAAVANATAGAVIIDGSAALDPGADPVTLTMRFVPPNGPWVEAVVTATFTPREPTTGQVGTPALVKVLVRDRETAEQSTPAPGVPAALLLGLALAASARRRRG